MMVCCQEVLVQQEEKMSTSTAKKKKNQKEAGEKSDTIEDTLRGPFFLSSGFYFSGLSFYCSLTYGRDTARGAVASPFSLFFCSVSGR